MTGLRIERKKGKEKGKETLATISYLGPSGVELHFTKGGGEPLGMLRINDWGLMWYPKRLGARRIATWKNGKLNTRWWESNNKT